MPIPPNHPFNTDAPQAARGLTKRWTSTMKCFYVLGLFLVTSCSTVRPAVDPKAEVSCRKQVEECSCQRPKYPAESLRNREQGLVRLKILVSHEGRAKDVVVERSSGYRRLDEAAVEGAK
jgi:outer membrane biosynthesis protein TonB